MLKSKNVKQWKAKWQNNVVADFPQSALNNPIAVGAIDGGDKFEILAVEWRTGEVVQHRIRSWMGRNGANDLFSLDVPFRSALERIAEGFSGTLMFYEGDAAKAYLDNVVALALVGVALKQEEVK